MNPILPSQFLLKTLDHEEIQLEELLSPSKKNLLLFYHTNCLGCTGRAIPFAYDLLKKNPTTLNLIVIHADFGTTDNSKEEILEIFHTKEAPFPIYRDVDAKLYHTLHCEGTPHWILLSENGAVLNSIFGSQDNAQLRLHYMLEEG